MCIRDSYCGNGVNFMTDTAVIVGMGTTFMVHGSTAGEVTERYVEAAEAVTNSVLRTCKS